MLGTNTAQFKLIRKYLKTKILEDNVTFCGHNLQRLHVYDLMRKTILNGEAHSALIIGPRGSGKTTLINSVLEQLSSETDLASDALVIKLSGLLHHDDKVAFNAITAQMQLDNAVGDKVFGSFAENLAFLLSCLRTGADRRCKSMLFVLDEFDMFCHSTRTQTLLYNLFDLTHTGQAPLCVIGLTSRLDVMELLEKRVKSRFSHRLVHLHPTGTGSDGAPVPAAEAARATLVRLLSVPVRRVKRGRKKMEVDEDEEPETAVAESVLSRCKMADIGTLAPAVAERWNTYVRGLAQEQDVIDALEKLSYYTVDQQVFRDILFQLVCRLSPAAPLLPPLLPPCSPPPARELTLQSLSVLELSLVIAMKQARDIFDGQPANFEMVLHRYTRFSNAHSSTQSAPRAVVLKAFEHLQALEIIVAVRGGAGAGDVTGSRAQKEYQWFTLAVPSEEIERAVKGFRALPTEIAHWFNSQGD